MKRQWAAFIVVISLVSAGAFADQRPGANCSLSGGVNTDFFYTLVQVNTADATTGTYPATDAVDRVVTIGKQTNVGTIAMTNAANTECGKVHNGSAWITDTRFPTTGSQYSESFAVILATDNSAGARFPRNVFFRNLDPNPGTKMRIERLESYTCQLTSGADTLHFYKTCVGNLN
jgi:hypothetical protein